MAILTVTDWSVAPITFNKWGGENLLDLTVGNELGRGVVERTAQLYVIDGGYAGTHELYGSDLAYDGSGKFSGGVVMGWDFVWPYADGVIDTRFSIAGLSMPATSLREVGLDSDYDLSFNAAPVVFAGDDSMTGGSGGDTLGGYAGNDIVLGNAGNDAINGNQGQDTVYGGAGDDLARGGKDNDLVFGGEGNDLIYGDLGNDVVQGNQGIDTLDGGDGSDTIHGGQGDDVIFGGAGDDYVSGDRGNDTITGGAGADVFHSFAQNGTDRVTDFDGAEGDRIRLDPGTTYTLVQSGADTIIDMGGGNQMILVGVQSSTLPSGWITVG